MTSSVSGTSSSSTNYTRLSGLVSGMDTDTLVQKMLSGDKAKIQKYEANLQIDDWKTDAYRDITSSLQTFYKTYFDSLSTTNMKSENMFASFSTSYGNTTDSNYVTVTAGAGAKAGLYSITSMTAATSAALTGTNPSKPVESGTINLTDLGSISSANNQLTITFNGIAKAISLPTDGSITTVDQLKVALQGQIDTAFGAGKITVGDNSTVDGISFTAARNTDSFSISSSGTANSVLGLTSSNLSNKVDLNTHLSDLTNSIGQAYDSSATSYDTEFTINGKYFRFNSNQTSLQDIMDTVNSDSTINATMSYDNKTNSFTVKSKSTGDTDNLVVADVTGTLMTKLGVAGTDNGSDANITFSDGTVIVRPTNSFTYDGLSYNIKQDYSGADKINVTVNTDTSKTFDLIKGFVTAYNTLIDKINGKLTEKTYKDYQPLTEDQKSAMSEDQIKQWEDKAKSGLLKNDSILSGIVTKLRSVLYDTVQGAGISLSSIGITTSADYTQNGKLEINETKLKEALVNKGEQITKLFTASSDKTYYDAINSSTIRNERYSESGIAQRMSDIIQDAIRTNTDKDGNKGTLLEKAGIVGDRSEYTNILFKDMASLDETITELNSKLQVKEDSLYARFTAMESALEKMNSQQSYITQMLGGS